MGGEFRGPSEEEIGIGKTEGAPAPDDWKKMEKFLEGARTEGGEKWRKLVELGREMSDES